MSSAPLRKVLSVGSIAVDVVYVHPDLKAIGDFKAQAKHAYMQAGGGGANMAIAMRELNRIFDRNNDITLCTKVGLAPPGDKLAELTRTIALDQIHGLTLIDAVPDTQHIIPFNSPVSYAGGRFISTRFTEATLEYQQRVAARIQTEAQTSNIVFIHSRYPRLSLIAAQAARKHNIPVFLDYSVEKPGEIYDSLLGLATYVVAPGEARVASMNQEDPAELCRILSENYGIPHVAVSNGTDPVLIRMGSKQHSIDVPRADAVIDALGVGDLRNATAITALLHGHDFTTAIAQGTAMATFSVGYPGRDWIKDAPSFMRAHPLFARDFEQTGPAAAPAQDGPGGVG